MIALIQSVRPDLYIDVHVTDGMDYQYDITYGFMGRDRSYAASPQHRALAQPALPPRSRRSARAQRPHPRRSHLRQQRPRARRRPRRLHLLPALQPILRRHDRHAVGADREPLAEAVPPARARHVCAARRKPAPARATTAAQLRTRHRRRRTRTPAHAACRLASNRGAGVTAPLPADRARDLSLHRVRRRGNALARPRRAEQRACRNSAKNPPSRSRRPRAYWVPATKPDVINVLRLHGVQFETITEARTVERRNAAPAASARQRHARRRPHARHRRRTGTHHARRMDAAGLDPRADRSAARRSRHDPARTAERRFVLRLGLLQRDPAARRISRSLCAGADGRRNAGERSQRCAPNSKPRSPPIQHSPPIPTRASPGSTSARRITTRATSSTRSASSAEETRALARPHHVPSQTRRARSSSDASNTPRLRRRVAARARPASARISAHPGFAYEYEPSPADRPPTLTTPSVVSRAGNEEPSRLASSSFAISRHRICAGFRQPTRQVAAEIRFHQRLAQGRKWYEPMSAVSKRGNKMPIDRKFFRLSQREIDLLRRPQRQSRRRFQFLRHRGVNAIVRSIDVGTRDDGAARLNQCHGMSAIERSRRSLSRSPVSPASTGNPAPSAANSAPYPSRTRQFLPVSS